MAPWSGRKVLRIIENVTNILAAELLVASRASILFHGKLSAGVGTKPVLNLIKRNLKIIHGDHPYGKEIEAIAQLLKDNKIINTVKKQVKLV